MGKYHIYGIGAALVDTEIEVSDTDLELLSVEKGLMTLVDEDRQHELMQKLEGHLITAKRASGGSAANSIIAASYFGSKAFYSCKVADDENGQFYLQDLRNAGVDANHNAATETGITGKCLVMITPDAERSMNTFLGISETLSSDNLDKDAIANSDFIYIEGYLVTSRSGRAAAIEARKIAQQHQAKVAISLSDPGMVEFFKDGLTEIIGEGVDLIFCNEDEALGWADSDNLDTAIAELQKISNAFAITRGSRGALLWDGKKIIDIAAHKVTAVDTNGAGDMFAGAFLHAIASGQSFTQAGNLASLASATVVANYGPRLAAEKHDEILKQLAAVS